MMTKTETDIRTLLMGRKTVHVTWEDGQGIVVSAVPDFESQSGLLCGVALNVKTLEEAETVSQDQLVQINHHAFTTYVTDNS